MGQRTGLDSRVSERAQSRTIPASTTEPGPKKPNLGRYGQDFVLEEFSKAIISMINNGSRKGLTPSGRTLIRTKYKCASRP